MPEEIAPCVNIDCPNYTGEWRLNCSLDLGAKITKCNAYRPQKPKRPITVKELFEAGATHVSGALYVSQIVGFSINDNAICLLTSTLDVDPVLGWMPVDAFKSMQLKDIKWTADRQTWNDFEVDDNA